MIHPISEAIFQGTYVESNQVKESFKRVHIHYFHVINIQKIILIFLLSGRICVAINPTTNVFQTDCGRARFNFGSNYTALDDSLTWSTMIKHLSAVKLITKKPPQKKQSNYSRWFLDQGLETHLLIRMYFYSLS